MIEIIRLTRVGLLLVTISMLSGCCCLWYVEVKEPEVFSERKMKKKDYMVENPNFTEKEAKKEFK